MACELKSLTCPNLQASEAGEFNVGLFLSTLLLITNTSFSTEPHRDMQGFAHMPSPQAI